MKWFASFTRTIRAAIRSQGAEVSDSSLSSTTTESPPRITSFTVIRRPGTKSTTSVERKARIAKGGEVIEISLVENMSMHICGQCGHEENLFPGGIVEELAQQHGVPYLGRIPFDPRMAVCADGGSLYLEEYGDVPATNAVGQIAQRLGEFLNR